MKWKHFPRYWPFVRGIHRSPVNTPNKVEYWKLQVMSSIFRSSWKTPLWINVPGATKVHHCWTSENNPIARPWQTMSSNAMLGQSRITQFYHKLTSHDHQKVQRQHFEWRHGGVNKSGRRFADWKIWRPNMIYHSLLPRKQTVIRLTSCDKSMISLQIFKTSIFANINIESYHVSIAQWQACRLTNVDFYNDVLHHNTKRPQ